jgi:hypothetical protein
VVHRTPEPFRLTEMQLAYLGATSLMLVRAHRELRTTCAPELTVLDLFAHPSIRALAAHAGAAQSTVESAGPVVEQDVDPVVLAARHRGRGRAGRLARHSALTSTS